MSASVANMRQLPQLDGLTAVRGLAAWWVVFYHFTPFLYGHLPMDVWWLAKKGFLAVDLFFILSGFVIYYTYHQDMTATVTSVRSFLVKRLARVYPLHVLILLGYVGLIAALYVVKDVIMAPEKFTGTQFALQLLMVQAWGFETGTALSWNYPAWSISAEFAAYLFFPFLFLVLKPQKWPTWALLLMIGAMIVLLIAYYFRLGICPDKPDDMLQNVIVQTPLICTFNREIDLTAVPRCLTQFTIGACLCILYFRAGRKQKILGLPALAAGALLMIAGAVLRWPDVYFATLGWTLLVFGIACAPMPSELLLNNRPMIWLGDISYATYMCHALVRDVYKFVAVSDTGDPYVPFYAPAWTLIAVFAIILVISHFLYFWFERPAQKRVRSWLAPKRKMPA